MDTSDTRDGLRDQGKKIEQDLSQFGRTVEKRGSELLDNAFSFVREHPYAAVGGAFVAGWILSGALFSRSTAKLFGFGARFIGGALVKQALAGGALGMLAPLVQGNATDTSTSER